MGLVTVTPWPFRLKGYRRCLRLPVCPSVYVSEYPSGNFTFSARYSSQIWAGIKVTPNMHSRIFLPGFENWCHWPWPSRSFWLFLIQNSWHSACPRDNCFELKSPNLHQIYILGFSQLALKMWVIDLDLQGRLAISTTFVYWFRPAPVRLYRIKIQFPIKDKVSECYSLSVCREIKWWKITDIAMK